MDAITQFVTKNQIEKFIMKQFIVLAVLLGSCFAAPKYPTLREIASAADTRAVGEVQGTGTGVYNGNASESKNPAVESRFG